MFTEIKWSIVVSVAGRTVASIALSTIDLSFPERYIMSLRDEYGPCHVTVYTNGRRYDRDLE